MGDSAFEYGKKMEQAGPQARRVAARYGLKVGDGTVLSNILKPGDSEDSKARLARAGLIEEDANGRQRITATGNAMLDLMGAADRLDTAEDMVDPAVDVWARPKIEEAKEHFDHKQAALDEAMRRRR